MTYAERYAASLMNTFGPPQLTLVRGSGTRVWDEEGNEYLDLLGGIAVNSLGHAHPALVAAVTAQLSELGHISNFFSSPPQIQLAERLLSLLGQDGRVFFTNSGTEASEAAFKLARRTGRVGMVATEGAFHGRTMGALALTAKQAYRTPFEPLPGEVTFVPFGDSAALEAAVGPGTAAIVLEPIQGEAGVVEPPADYLAAARRIATDAGALLWLDEVQTGIGRTGAWFAHQREAVEPVRPDVVTLAKGLGGGMPIGACVAFGAASTLLQPGNHGTTFGGNPPACAAALAVLDTIVADDLIANAVRRGDQLRRGLEATSGVVEVTGSGLLLGIQLESEIGPEIVAAARQHGVILNSTGPSRLRLAPALTLSQEDVDYFLARWPGILSLALATSKESR